MTNSELKVGDQILLLLGDILEVTDVVRIKANKRFNRKADGYIELTNIDTGEMFQQGLDIAIHSRIKLK